MLLRCNKEQFNILLALIENNHVFHGENSEKQFTVQFQLALVLYRLGTYGEKWEKWHRFSVLEMEALLTK